MAELFHTEPRQSVYDTLLTSITERLGSGVRLVVDVNVHGFHLIVIDDDGVPHAGWTEPTFHEVLAAAEREVAPPTPSQEDTR